MEQNVAAGSKPIKIPGPDHPITIERNPVRIVVSVAGRVVADTREALMVREAAYSRRPIHPRARTSTWRYFSRPIIPRTALIKVTAPISVFRSGTSVRPMPVWTYKAPCARQWCPIKDHLAFYPDRVDAIEERPEA